MTNTNDSGPGSLRAAIEAANTRVGPDTIVFAIPETDPNFIDIDSSEPGGDEEADVFIIRPLSPLPPLDDPTGGTTFASCHANRNSFGPDIVISGELAGAGANGFELASNNNKISGVTIQNFGGSGIVISGGTGNAVTGNYIGTDALGRSAAPNGGDGIAILGGAAETLIGVSKPWGEIQSVNANKIAFNEGAGVSVAGNSQGNVIRGNKIFGNRELGIDLIDDGERGIISNDDRNLDADAGPNGLQNFPIINYVGVGSETRLRGRIVSAPSTTLTLDFYSTDASNASTEEEIIQGEKHIGTFTVTTDSHGVARFDRTFDANTVAGHVISATATSEDGTSEFTPFPLVINIATHGFNPGVRSPDWEGFRSGWHELGEILDAIPLDGSMLDDRVVTYVSEWESRDRFLYAFGALFAAKVAEAVGHELFADGQIARAGMAFVLEGWLKDLASGYQSVSAAHAAAAARLIPIDAAGLLLSSPTQSREFQRIHLVGHSRGGAVNAEVSRLLDRQGYVIDQYTTLDGFSLDWPDDGGLIGDIPIDGWATGNRLVNYLVEADLADHVLAKLDPLRGLAEPILEVTNGLTSIAPLRALEFSTGVLDRLDTLDLKAPARASFHDNIFLKGDPSDSERYPSDHLNVTGIYTDSGSIYTNSGERRPVEEQYIFDNYVGRLRCVGIEASSPDECPPAPAPPMTNLLQSQFVENDGSISAESASIEVFTRFSDFRDGSFESLGALLADVLATNPGSFGVDLLDAWLDILSNPSQVLASSWTVTGAAQLVRVDDNWVAELTQTDDTSISQWLDFGDRDPLWLGFDVEVVQSGGDDVVEVLFNDRVLANYGLAALESPARLRVDLSELIEREGDIRFRIAGSAETASIVRLDNLSVQVAGSRAQNPMIAADVDDNGLVTARDALLVINKLGRSLPPGQSSIPVNVDMAVPPYYDVSGDGQISRLDALLVINVLARQSVSSSQGEGEGDAVALSWAVFRSQMPTIGSVRDELATLLLEPELQKLVVRSELGDPEVDFFPGELIDRVAPDPERSDSENDDLAAVDEALALFF